MRYRKLDTANDMTFGHGGADYLVDNAAAVAQAVRTALLLFQGEWFLDTTVGVPWLQKITGYGTAPTYDLILRTAILAVQGVTGIVSYNSVRNGRQLLVTVTVSTEFSNQAAVAVDLTLQGGYGVGGYGAGGYGT